MLEIQLNNEEQVTEEAGAMVYIKGHIEVKTTTRSGRGFFKKFKVAAFGRQSLLLITMLPMKIIALLA